MNRNYYPYFFNWTKLSVSSTVKFEKVLICNFVLVLVFWKLILIKKFHKVFSKKCMFLTLKKHGRHELHRAASFKTSEGGIIITKNIFEWCEPFERERRGWWKRRPSSWRWLSDNRRWWGFFNEHKRVESKTDRNHRWWWWVKLGNKQIKV